MNAPATTFEHGGKQYVVALSAGNLLIGSAKGDSVWLFGLDGTLPPTTERDTERPHDGRGAGDVRARGAAAAPVAAATSATPAASDAGAALILAGEEVFRTACVAVPRRRRHGRARRRCAARSSQGSDSRHGDGHRRPRQHAAARRAC